jgi:biotin carboxylase
LAFIAEVGYPVIAKPDVGVGAAATYKIHNAAELTDFFAEARSVDYLLEAFVGGDLYSFDGLTDRDGNIVFYTVHRFSQGIMETVNEGLDMYYYSLRDIPEGLKDVGFRTVAAFDIRERFFHIEFFSVNGAMVGDLAQQEGAGAAVGGLAGDQRWVALELNMRPPGGLTMDMFNYANDIDLYQQWANVVVSNSFTAKYTRRYHCGYAGRKRHRTYRLSHAEVLQKYNKFISHHEAISGIMAPAIGDYGYVVRARDLAVLLDVIEGILAPPEAG